MAKDVEKDIRAHFSQFITNLSVQFPNLSPNEIVEKMVYWVESQSDDQKSQDRITKKMSLLLHPDKLKRAISDGARYLKARASVAKEDENFYFRKIKDPLTFKGLNMPMHTIDPNNLQLIYQLLSVYQKKEAAFNCNKASYEKAHLNPKFFYNIFVKFINSNQNSISQEKRLLAKRIVRHFQGAENDILARTNYSVANLSEADVFTEGAEAYLDKRIKETIAVQFFKSRVSDKNYRIYFDNLENEVVPPEGFFAARRFHYRNDVAFLWRVLKNHFWGILEVGLIVTSVLMIVSLVYLTISVSLPVMIGLMEAGGAVAALALAVIAAGIFVLSLPWAAAYQVKTNNLWAGYVFSLKVFALTVLIEIPGLIMDGCSFLYSLIFKKSTTPDQGSASSGGAGQIPASITFLEDSKPKDAVVSPQGPLEPQVKSDPDAPRNSSPRMEWH